MSPSIAQDELDSRVEQRTAFLNKAGWADVELMPVGEDCAFRRYFRLRRGGESVILMEAVPDASSFATPGHALRDFVRISAYLRKAGLHTPEIYEADEITGYLLLEDFGDVSFQKALDTGENPVQLYTLATDILRKLQQEAGDIVLPDYYQSHVHAGRRRIVDWYVPVWRKVKNPDGLVQDYLAVWDCIERTLPPCPQGFLHIDYHVENLMWRPQRERLAQCGVLDFQGAMYGPLPYDLANLLEDARRDVKPGLRTAMIARYTTGMNGDDCAVFKSWYRVMATQFHCRVAGQFIRLAVHDGKARYLQHLPRVIAYLRQGLEDPLLLPLRQWFTDQGVDFLSVPQIDIVHVKTLIRDDAF